MRKQFWVNTILAVALLFSQGGNLLVASLCPHLQSAMPNCGTHLDAQAMAHGNIEHAEMGSMEHSAAANQDEANAFALAQSATTCPHCAIHSRTTSYAVSLRQSEAARRLHDAIIPLRFSRTAGVTVPPFPVPVSRAHGPPGTSKPRHILISIFRI